MRPTVSKGDVALAAHAATAKSFSPFGRLLRPGDRAFLGQRGKVLVAVDEKRAGPRRVTDLYRYPQAKRAVVPLGSIPMWFVAAGAGERPSSEASAFLLPPGCGLVVDPGVWHAGPVPLTDAALCEMLETIGASDRFDRRSVRDLLGVEAVRVVMPADPTVGTAALDLTAPGAILLDASWQGSLRLGCLLIEDLEAKTAEATLQAELQKAAEGLRAMWGHVSDLGEIPGVAAGREVYLSMGLDVERAPPRSEALLAHVLAGRPVIAGGAIEEALALCALRARLPMAAFDESAVRGQIVARKGAPGEGYEGTEARRRVSVEGRPVLCDADGPFGCPLGDARRVRTGPTTRRALVVVYLPDGMAAPAAGDLMDGIATTLSRHCGGREGARLIVG